MMLLRLTVSILTVAFPLFSLAVLNASEPEPHPPNQRLSVSDNAEDQFLLGRAYARGEGVSLDYETAGFWYLKAAEKGNLKALHNLGILYLMGRGTPKNEPEGYRWIRLAAEKGDAGSAYLTGILLLKGTGVKQDIAAGVTWLRKAADAGNADALARLGQDAYFGDDGIKKDLTAAIPLIRSAAEKGNLWACDTMGILYMKGEGVQKDEHLGQAWLSKGSHAGPIIP